MSDFRPILKQIGMTQTQVAAVVGKHVTHIHRILKGEIHPENPLALAIEAATNGAITAAELKGLPRPITPAA